MPNLDAHLYQQLRQVIDQGDQAAIQAIFYDHPGLDWNAVTSNGLSALWWALAPSSQIINIEIIDFLLNLRRDDQYAIDPSQEYAGLRPDYYVDYFSTDISSEQYQRLKELILSAQARIQPTPSPAQLNELAADAHGASNPIVLRASDASLKRLYQLHGTELNNEDKINEILQDFHVFFKTNEFKSTFPLRAREQDPIYAALARIQSNLEQRVGMDRKEGPTTLKEELALVWMTTTEKDLSDVTRFDRRKAILTALLEAQTAYGHGNNPSCWAGTWGRIGTALCGMHEEVYYVKEATGAHEIVLLDGEQARQKYNALVANELSNIYLQNPSLYWAILRELLLDEGEGKEGDQALYQAWRKNMLPRVHQNLIMTPVVAVTADRLIAEAAESIPIASHRLSEQFILLQSLFNQANEAKNFKAILLRLKDDDINDVIILLKTSYLSYNKKIPDDLSSREQSIINQLQEAVLEAYFIRRDEDNNPLQLSTLWPALRIEAKIASLPDPSCIKWCQALPFDQQQLFFTECEHTIEQITVETIIDFALQNNCLIGLSLQGRNLREKDLRGLDLRDVDFSHADLCGADLRLMKAAGAKWDQCDLMDAGFNPWIYPEALLGSVHCTTELLHAQNFAKHTLLHFTIINNQPEIAKAILASQHCTPAMLVAQNIYNYTALHRATSEDQLEIVKAIITSQHCTPTVLSIKGKNNYTAVHFAAASNNPEILKTFLESVHCTSALLRAKNDWNQTILHIAAYNVQPENIKTILASTYCTHEILNEGALLRHSVLDIAVSANKVEHIKAILASPLCTAALFNKNNFRNTVLNTVLYETILYGRDHIFNVIIESPHLTTKVLTTKNDMNETTLHLAIKFEQVKYVKAILESPHCTADVLNATDGANRTTLHWAIMFNQIVCVKAILESPHCTTDVLNTKNNENQTALHLAIFKNKTEIVKAILESPHCTPGMRKEAEPFVLASTAKDSSTLPLANEESKNDPIVVQRTNVSYSFVLKVLGALAVSAAKLTIGLLIPARVTIPPVVVKSALVITGVASAGFFIHKAYKHQSLVNAYANNDTTREPTPNNM